MQMSNVIRLLMGLHARTNYSNWLLIWALIQSVLRLFDYIIDILHSLFKLLTKLSEYFKCECMKKKTKKNLLLFSVLYPNYDYSYYTLCHPGKESSPSAIPKLWDSIIVNDINLHIIVCNIGWLFIRTKIRRGKYCDV